MALVFLLAGQVCALAESGAGGSDSVTETPRNGIPLLVIYVDEQELHQSKKGNWYGTIADMNESPDHSVRCEGSIIILLPEQGYQSEYGGTAPAGTIELDYIRGEETPPGLPAASVLIRSS